MTTITTDSAPRELTRPAWTRLFAPLGGLLLVAGLVALLVSPAGDDSGETAADVVGYATSHEGWLTGVALFGVASIALCGVFVAGLLSRLRHVATALEASLVLIGGTAFTLCFASFLTIWSAPLVDTPDEPARALAHAETYLALEDIGWFTFGAAGVAAAVMAVPASLAAMRAGLPAWLGWLGVAAGLASVATVAFFGLFAWMAWIAAASVVMLVGRGDG